MQRSSTRLAVLTLVGLVVACSLSPDVTPQPGLSTVIAATFLAITPQSSPTAPVALATLAPPPATLAPPLAVPGFTRINFLSGATTGVVSAPIAPSQTLTYILGAAQGQPMIAQVDSANHDVMLSIKTQGGTSLLSASALQSSWRGTLPQTEDYLLTVHGGSSTENFTLTVEIVSRIKFQEGAVSAKMSGKTVAGYNVAYAIFAIKGQKLELALAMSGGEAALSVWGFADGQPYLRSATEQTSFKFTLPSTQDYILEVVPKAGKVVNYVVFVKIQ